uniref:Uncharacterized protein n=1 Tax=Siphoviridae sp. ct2wG4 TaxID=2826278 RepID=A0A8S5QX05_9CAUD|nr:MAG TPA: hypothetical protein [Siphoviridae sp. ct2wG4]DAU49707.1 MAG TPA: hypothetical protein [Caudoviricetes sp.]
MAGFILFSREDSCVISVCEFTTNRLRDLKSVVHSHDNQSIVVNSLQTYLIIV